MKKRAKVIITGSCGFILSNFVRYVLKTTKNYTLVSIDKAIKNKSLNNIYINPSHNFYLADVADAHVINRIFEKEKPDYVVHGAALSHVDDSIAGAAPFIHSNVMGTQVIVDACVKFGIKKLVLLSTDEIYGHLETEDAPAWDEGSPPNPRNPYSASKMSSELIVNAAHTTHGLNFNITRSCNNFGPRQSPKNLIPKIIKNIINNEKIPIYGDGSNIREWVHVLDNCSAILKILESGTNTGIYNISAGWSVSNLEMVNRVCNIAKNGHNLISFIKDPRPGHDFRYAVNSSKLLSLGWQPAFSFAGGLEHCVQWYLTNKWFLE